LGETDHSWIQTVLSAYLFGRRNEWGITVLVEQRVQVTTTRFRVPDICVIQGPKPTEQILTKPPFICIEILSPEDRWPRTQQRGIQKVTDDYLTMGVPYVWVLDPATKTAYSATPTERTQQVTAGVLKTHNPSVEVPFSEIFA
jgi:Uma2 family endonuclease